MRAGTGRGRRTGRRGATIVEFALVLQIFLLLMFGVFECGRLMMVRQIVAGAARGAARQASAGTYSKVTADIEATARRLLAGQDFAGVPAVSIYAVDAAGHVAGAWDDAEFGNGIAVRIDADYRPLVPTFGVFPSTFRVSATSVMRSEGD